MGIGIIKGHVYLFFNVCAYVVIVVSTLLFVVLCFLMILVDCFLICADCYLMLGDLSSRCSISADF